MPTEPRCRMAKVHFSFFPRLRSRVLLITRTFDDSAPMQPSMVQLTGPDGARTLRGDDKETLAIFSKFVTLLCSCPRSVCASSGLVGIQAVDACSLMKSSTVRAIEKRRSFATIRMTFTPRAPRPVPRSPRLLRPPVHLIQIDHEAISERSKPRKQLRARQPNLERGKRLVLGHVPRRETERH